MQYLELLPFGMFEHSSAYLMQGGCHTFESVKSRSGDMNSCPMTYDIV